MSNSLNALLATAALALAGITGPLATSASAAAQGSKVILLTVTDECSYCALHKKAFLEEAAKHGLEVEVKINNFDPAEQATQVDQALGEAPDAMVVWPADANAIVPSLRKIKTAGVPLVVTNSLPDQKYSKFWDAFTGPDDIGNGSTSAEALIEGFKERGLTEGNVFVIVGPLGTPPQIQRLEGFTKTLEEKAPGIKILGTQPGNWDQTQSTDAAASLFTQFGDQVQGVYAEADNMLAGVIVAAQRAGIDPKSLVLVGHNCSIEGVTALENGTQYATVLQSPIDDGIYAAQAVANLLDGKEVESVTFLPHPMIKQAQVKDCYPAVGK